MRWLTIACLCLVASGCEDDPDDLLHLRDAGAGANAAAGSGGAGDPTGTGGSGEPTDDEADAGG